ncbi:TonB-dependent receptor [Peristeroidobacter soli]|uniref:TonB-dependent receptor n=1 Tax=Peristeroidobacter soli TaxID=2497877 RepID=UPI0015893713|nr:TonB-dependent receptor [Peristeroidobacter soli]
MRVSIAVAIALSAVAISATSAAQAAIRKQTHIAAQELETALQGFARQRDLQIIFRSTLVKDLRTTGVAGDLTVDEVLQQLLGGSGLGYRYLDERTITIVPPAPGGRTGDVSNSHDKGPFWSRFRLAQADVSSAQSGQAVESDAGPRGDSARTPQKISAEEVLVTGSRLKQESAEGVSPLTVFAREKLNQLGVTNVADALKYLTQQASWAGDANRPGGAREVRLRGLAGGTTLVLINGRRAVVSGLGTSQNFFDLNTIPLAAVERVEVLADSASAVYGADAVGGVVNIVLKSEIEAPTADVYYGTADGGGRERRASGSIGHSWERARVGVVMDYYDRGGMLGGERDITSNADYRRFGSTDQRTTATNPANVCSTNGANLPGLSAPCAVVPVGSTGVGLTPADFAATAGQQNRDTLGRYRDLIASSERKGGLIFGDVSLTDQVTAFAELLFNRLESRNRLGPEPRTNMLVPASNAFNPFGQTVSVNYAFTNDLGRAQYAESESWRAVGGLKGELGGWDWEISAVGFEDVAWQDNSRNAIDTARLTAALASSDPATAFNPFQDGPGGSDALLRSLVADPLPSRFFTTSRATQLGAFARGALFTLPAGDVQLVIGAESRKEDARIRVTGMNYVVNGDRKTWATYAETRVPLVGESMQVPGARRIALTLAGRYDNYDDFGGVFNPKYGVEWYPIESLLLRATYGTNYRAPSLWDLYAPQYITPNAVMQDPARNDETAVYVRSFGGNPSLQPEESDSMTAGLVFMPEGEGGLKIAASFWRISQDLRINLLDPLLIVRSEALFHDRVLREPQTPADIAAGVPGRLISVDSTSVNFGSLKVHGIDLEMSRPFDSAFGRFSPTVATTWIGSYEVADFPGQLAVQRVATAGGSSMGAIPRWRAVAALDWLRNGVGLTATARYMSGYADGTFGVPNGLHVPEQTFVDLQARIDFDAFGDSWLGRGTSIRLGVNNLFDRAPSFSNSTQQGFDATTSDMRQRFGYLNLTKRF